MDFKVTPVPVPPIILVPNELLVQIFSYIQADIRDSTRQRHNKGSIRTLKSIALTCRHFAPPAQELLIIDPAIVSHRRDGVGLSHRNYRSGAHNFNSPVVELIHMLMKLPRLQEKVEMLYIGVGNTSKLLFKNRNGFSWKIQRPNLAFFKQAKDIILGLGLENQVSSTWISAIEAGQEKSFFGLLLSMTPKLRSLCFQTPTNDFDTREHFLNMFRCYEDRKDSGLSQQIVRCLPKVPGLVTLKTISYSSYAIAQGTEVLLALHCLDLDVRQLPNIYLVEMLVLNQITKLRLGIDVRFLHFELWNPSNQNMHKILSGFQTLITLELYDASVLNKSDPRVYLDDFSSNTTSVWAGNFSALLTFIAPVTSTIETLHLPCNWILRDKNRSTIITLPRLTRWGRLRRLVIPQAALDVGLKPWSGEETEDDNDG